MTRVPCVEAVAAVLGSEGVDTVFGIAAMPPLYAALRKRGVRHVAVRHEGAGTHAADGWARATGKVGVSIGTSGPAGTNMITGLCTARADSTPMLCITGQAPRATLHQEAFQAVDIVEIARPVTKWAVRLEEPAQAPWVFREAFRIARSGRPGPVLVDLPLAVQRGTCVYDPALDAPLPVDVPRPQPVAAAVQMLLDAARPIILAGSGVIGAEATDELRQLAEHLQVPVQVTLTGRGAFPEDHPLFAGTAGSTPALLESDLVLIVGARHTGDLETYRRGRRFIHVDIEPTRIAEVFEPDLGIVGHARPTLAALAQHARRAAPQHAPCRWVERVAELRSVRLPEPPRVYRELDGAFGPDTTFVTAIGQFQRAYRPRHHLVCGEAGPPGWEVPAAIGVKCAFPGEQVVAVVAGRPSPFLVAEVAVAARYRIPFVIVLVDDGHPGLARQAELGEGGVDHVMLMAAFGCPARRVERPEEIADALVRASLESEARQLPVLVEVVVERGTDAATGRSPDALTELDPAPAPPPASLPS